MKRIIALLLSVLMLFSVVACGSEQAQTTTGEEMKTTAEETKKTEENKKTEEDLTPVQPAVPTPSVPDEGDNKPAEEEKKEENNKPGNAVYNNPSTYVPSAAGIPNFNYGNAAPSAAQVKIPGFTAPAKKYGTLVTDLSNYPTHLLGEKKLTLADLKAIPIAKDSMTSQQLRQIVMDYFELQLSFTWTPNEDVLDYPTTYASSFGPNNPKTLEQGNIYGGIPYQSTGTGNLYRWFEYYDEETGIFYLTDALNDNGGYGEGAAITGEETDEDGNTTYKKYKSMMLMFNQCSVASFWGWGRVVNSASFAWTADMNVYNGFIPVGFYTYPDAMTLVRFGQATDTYPNGMSTSHIRTYVGRTKMYESYAKMLPGDCLVDGPGHAMMVKEVIVDSSNLANSKVVCMEQVEGWGYQGEIDGVTFKNQGRDGGELTGKTYTFSQLYSSGYIGMTFAEYHKGDESFWAEMASVYHAAYDADVGADAVDAYIAKLRGSEATEDAKVWADGFMADITAANLKNVTVNANYPISDMFVEVKDVAGNVLVDYVYRSTRANITSVSLNRSDLNKQIEAHTGGKKTIEVSLQLSNGEKLPVFTSTIG